MKLLIAEDDSTKASAYFDFALGIGFRKDEIIVASHLAEFAAKFDGSVGVCIIDLRIPAFAGDSVGQNGIGVLQAIIAAGASNVGLLAVSSFPEEFSAVRSQFERQGCLLVSYHETDVWQNALRTLTVKCRSRTKFDFLIFCALSLERLPYMSMRGLNGRPVHADGLSRYDVNISGCSGSIIQLPRMGLVDAAATVSKCIERFSPRLVAMSGICAGFEGRAKLGSILVSDVVFEYQSGKWTHDGFAQEPYQVQLRPRIRNLLSALLSDTDLPGRLEAGWSGVRPSVQSSIELATFVSGSSVVADQNVMGRIAAAHRRVAGLDMEVYSVHRAAYLSTVSPEVICVKTVVDLGDGSKDDALQPYGCYVSARLVIEAIETFFESGGLN